VAWPLPFRNGRRRERFLSYYGSGSLLFTIALWFSGFILGYALALWAFAQDLGNHGRSFGNAAYIAASMVFALGLTEVVPHGTGARALAIAAGGTGFASLALLVAYLPTLYQAFSRRETYISQLDARAGSPPSAGELLARNTGEGSDDTGPFLLAWEGWSADLLESLLSYPTLGFYRSHHENQSWLAALTAVLDTCSVVLVSEQRRPHRQAKLTYAMCRHAAVDLTRALRATPAMEVNRLDEPAYERLRLRLSSGVWHLPDDAPTKLAKVAERLRALCRRPLAPADDVASRLDRVRRRPGQLAAHAGRRGAETFGAALPLTPPIHTSPHRRGSDALVVPVPSPDRAIEGSTHRTRCRRDRP